MKAFINQWGLIGLVVCATGAGVVPVCAEGEQTNRIAVGPASEIEYRLEPILRWDSRNITRQKTAWLRDCVRDVSFKTASKDYDGAMADLNTFVKSNPKFGPVYTFRALLELDLGNADDAFFDCGQAIKLNPQAPFPYVIRGDVELEAFVDFTNALADFKKAVKLQPAMVEGYLKCAWGERMLNNYSNAFQYLDRAVEVEKGYDPASVRGRPYTQLGWMQADLGEYQKALGNFQKALDYDPTSERNWLRFWLLAVRLGNREDANFKLNQHLSSLSQARLRRWPEMCGRFLLGFASEEDLLRTANDPAAKGRFRKDGLCSAYYYIGMKHLLAGDNQSALTRFQKALDTHVIGYYEYESAAAEAARLKIK